MKKVAWITDSTCVLPDAFCQAHHIYKLPLQVIVDGTSFQDGVNISPDDVFSQIGYKKITTSQPSPNDFITLYEQLKEEYDVGISYHISSKLSGTHSTSVQAAEMVGFPLRGIDSKSGIHPMSMLLKDAVLDYESGTDLDTVLHHLEQNSSTTSIYFTVENLQQLHQSGRVKGTQALLGTLLNIKPLFCFDNGEVVPIEKLRSRKKALAKLVSYLQIDRDLFDVVHVSIFHGADEESATSLKELLQSEYGITDVEIHPISPVVGTLTGKGTIGLTWIRKPKQA